MILSDAIDEFAQLRSALATAQARVKALEAERLDIFDAGGYFAVKIALPKAEADRVRMATEDWIVEKIRAALRPVDQGGGAGG